MRIYGLMGKKKAGKDLFCTIAQTTMLHHEIRRYAFADALKRFCIEYLGVPESSCFGTQEQKANIIGEYSDFFNEELCKQWGKNPSDEISGREVLQLTGTQVFRNCFKPTIWVDYVLREIKEFEEEFDASEREKIAIITDARFINEFNAVHNTGGKMIRLYRHTDDYKDCHESEKEMDQLDSGDFDHIIEEENNVNKDDLTKEVERIFKAEGLL